MFDDDTVGLNVLCDMSHTLPGTVAVRLEL